MTQTAPVIEPDIDERIDVESDESTDEDRPWVVVVWDDPVNTIPYVIFVFRKLFGYSEKKATRLTMQVHNEGKATVSDGPREKMEIECYQLHSFGLWATIEKS